MLNAFKQRKTYKKCNFERAKSPEVELILKDTVAPRLSNLNDFALNARA